MKYVSNRVRGVGAAVAASLLLWTASALALSPSQTARILAGLPVEEEAAAELRGANLTAFQTSVARHWEQYETEIAAPMQQWAEANIQQHPGGTIFYPFAGADFTTVRRLYPTASRYVLVALQPAGRVPDLTVSRSAAQGILDFFAGITNDYGRRGFFVTEEMNDQFVRGETLVVEGITPVLMAMAEREGFEVLSVEPIRVAADGSDVEIHDGNREAAGTWRSVRIQLRRRADGGAVTMDYLRFDLSNSNVVVDTAPGTFMANMTRHPMVLKAASHLLQYAGFSTLRRMMTENAPSIIQDESGLDGSVLLRHWDVRLYGRFRGVNTVFEQTLQQSMVEAYRNQESAGDVPFSFGYRKAAGPAIQYGWRRRE